MVHSARLFPVRLVKIHRHFKSHQKSQKKKQKQKIKLKEGGGGRGWRIFCRLISYLHSSGTSEDGVVVVVVVAARCRPLDDEDAPELLRFAAQTHSINSRTRHRLFN